jgi:hypothetical protein
MREADEIDSNGGMMSLIADDIIDKGSETLMPRRHAMQYSNLARIALQWQW